jgi:hypothetical protein
MVVRASQPSQIGVAGCENTICARVGRIALDCQEQFGHCLIKAASEEICAAEHHACRADAGARTEPKQSFEMLDRGVLPARPYSEYAADVLAPREIRIEGKCAVHTWSL